MSNICLLPKFHQLYTSYLVIYFIFIWQEKYTLHKIGINRTYVNNKIFPKKIVTLNWTVSKNTKAKNNIFLDRVFTERQNPGHGFYHARKMFFFLTIFIHNSLYIHRQRNPERKIIRNSSQYNFFFNSKHTHQSTLKGLHSIKEREMNKLNETK